MTVSNGAHEAFPAFSPPFSHEADGGCLHGLCLSTLTEPGYYADGHYGIRIENVVVVQQANTPHNFGDKGYLRFEHLTLVRSPSSLSSPTRRPILILILRRSVPDGPEPDRRVAPERAGEGLAERVPQGDAGEGGPARPGRCARDEVA